MCVCVYIFGDFMTQVLDCIETCMEAVPNIFYPRTLLSMALREYFLLCSYNKYFYSTELQREILHFLHLVVTTYF